LQEKYVLRGSILKCNKGNDLSALDMSSDHGIEPSVTLMSDCAINANVHSFGTCSCRKGSNDSQCNPVLCNNWLQTEKGTLMIWNEITQKYEEAVKESAVLTCSYGGLITVEEVHQKVTGIIGWEPHSGGVGLTQWKYIDESGSYVKGWLTRGKSSYFLDSDEYSVRGWKTIKSETESAQIEEIHYYFTVDGEMLMGWGGNGANAVQYYSNIENVVKFQVSITGLAGNYVKFTGKKSIEKIKDLAKRYPDKFDNKNYISDQNSYEKVIGTFGLSGNIPDNGCGSIAMYNVMHFLGNKITYEEILIDIIKDSVDLSVNQDQTKDYPTVLDGMAGLNPAYLKYNWII